MKSIRNSVTLIGRLGKDPEVKNLANTKKCTFSLATTDHYKNAQGEKAEDTQWHNIILWGKIAEVAEKYLKKGAQIAVEGRIEYRIYETDKGEKKYFTEINVNELEMLGGKSENG